ncbi:MAG: glycosyltransferase family 9 protein [Planctomycetes bacterium]|nr:glycosyltransferase family 9 protein [Planctomycetota bacterium]
MSTPLVVRLPNWVGDVCMALPALRHLARLPGVSLQVVGKAWAGDLLAGFPWRFQRAGGGIWAEAGAIAALGGERGVLLTNSLSTALAMRLGGVAAVGYRGDGRSLLLGMGVQRRRGEHEVEAFYRLALACERDSPWAYWHRRSRLEDGSPLPQDPPPRLGLVLALRHREQAAAVLAAAGIAPPYTVLCPLAIGTTHGRSKVWPEFARLCRDLVGAGRTIVACPGPGEDAATAAALPGATLLSGLELGAYAAILGNALRVVANDSGPMHLAAAVDAPVAGIFGVADPARTRPWGARAVTFGGAKGWPPYEQILAWALDGTVLAGGGDLARR